MVEREGEGIGPTMDGAIIDFEDNGAVRYCSLPSMGISLPKKESRVARKRLSDLHVIV